MILLGAGCEEVLELVQNFKVELLLHNLLIFLALHVFLDGVDASRYFVLSPTAFDLREPTMMIEA